MNVEPVQPIEYAEAYMRSHRVAVVSSVRASGEPWSWPVYYAYAQSRILFASRRTTKHAIDIGDGARVSFVITDTSQRPPISAHAIQAVGLARPATYKEYPLFARHYAPEFGKYGANMLSPDRLRQSLSDILASHPYVIELAYAKITDKRYYPEPVKVDFALEA